MKKNENSHLTGIGVVNYKDGFLTLSLLDNTDENDPKSFSTFKIRTEEYRPLICLLVDLGLKLQQKEHIDLNIPDPEYNNNISSNE